MLPLPEKKVLSKILGLKEDNEALCDYLLLLEL
jgi:hypothetical protein